MTAEAVLSKDADTIDVTTPSAGYAAGEVIQLPDGRAAVVCGLTAKVSGDAAALKTLGQHNFQKNSLVILKGALVYWDRSAGVASPIKDLATGDFALGVALEDAGASAADVIVDLNVKPHYLIDLHRDAFESLVVKTVVGSTTVTIPDVVTRGGQTQLTMGLTAEAQKVDLMSKNSIPKTIPFIVEGRVAVYDIGDAAALDINIGIANGTHATSFDSVTEYVSLHLDGNVLTILAQSTDGTTTVAAVTTTLSAVDDTYFDFAMDCRDLSDIQLYINGVNVLPASVFKLNAATGPFKLIAHMEKTSDDTPGEIRVAEFTARTMDIAA